MEHHREQLRRLCRLCGSDKGVFPDDRQPYSKLKFTSFLEQGLSIDINDDDEEIHPPYICHTCRLKIIRWKKDRRNKKGLPLNIRLFTFAHHSNECQICNRVSSANNDSKIESILSAQNFSHPALTKTVYDNRVQFVRLSEGEKIEAKLTIFNNCTWALTIHGKEITALPSLPNICNILSVGDMSDIINTVGNMHICIGNSGFEKLCRQRSPGTVAAIFKSLDGKSCVAYEETEGDYGNGCIRHISCKLIVDEDGMRCDVCKMYRSTLHASLGKLEGKKVCDFPAKKRNDYMTRSELESKLEKSTKENVFLKRRVNDMAANLKDYIERNGEVLDSDMSASFVKIMDTHESDVFCEQPEHSHRRILWEQQKKAISLSTKTSMRWHPAMIKWCIALHSKSASAYRLIKSSGALVLPHEQTLRKYTQYTSPSRGVNASVIKRIKDDLKFETLKDFQKNVTLVYDEMRIKDGLIYNRSSGKLIGFVDHDDINEEINNIVENSKNGENTPALATHMLALMIRGIFTPLSEVFAHYPCQGFTSYQLYWTIWRAVGVLEKARFKVRAFCSDGASPNRKFYRLHQEHRLQQYSKEPCYYTTNLYARSRKIFFICDPPHLMKTFRNNWENSRWNKKSRNLQVN